MDAILVLPGSWKRFYVVDHLNFLTATTINLSTSNRTSRPRLFRCDQDQVSYFAPVRLYPPRLRKQRGWHRPTGGALDIYSGLFSNMYIAFYSNWQVGRSIFGAGAAEALFPPLSHRCQVPAIAKLLQVPREPTEIRPARIKHLHWLTKVLEYFSQETCHEYIAYVARKLLKFR